MCSRNTVNDVTKWCLVALLLAGILGASPDGIILELNHHSLVEIKYPSSVDGCTIEERRLFMVLLSME